MDFIKNNKKFITTIMIALVIFARCNLGIVYSRTMVGANLLVDGLAFLYCVALVMDDRKLIKKGLLNPAVIWLVIFSIVVFVYGHFKIGVCADYYSRQYTLLTVVPPVLILIMLVASISDLLEIVANAGCIAIVSTFLTGVLYDSCYTEWFDGVFARVGKTPAGTSVDSANLYLILLVPILYRVIIEKMYKRYLWAALIAILGIMLTGSKAAMLPVIVVIALLALGNAMDKKALIKSVIVLALLLTLVVVLVINVPLLYNIVGDRFVELFRGVSATEYDLHTSTGQRMAVIAEFKKHFWEAPLFGHGFYAFKEMPYSQLEEYKVEGVAMYRNIQIHMNYLELLFGLGIFGFVLYYWLPVKLVIDSFRAKTKGIRLIGLSYLIAMAFIDLGLDMYYKYMVPYLAYLVVYCFILLDRDNNHLIQSEKN